MSEIRTVVYLLTAKLLVEAARDTQPPEKVRFVTGIRLLGGSVIVLTDLIEVAMEHASAVGATPHPAAVFRATQELRGIGMEIEAQFHSHPGSSAEATRPSRIDLNTARIWEKESPFLGAIFSEGGRYVRFFNHRQKSVIQVYGRVTAVGPDVYEIPSRIDAQVFTEAGGEGRLEPDPPTGVVHVVETAPPRDCDHPASWLRWARQQYREGPRANGRRTR